MILLLLATTSIGVWSMLELPNLMARIVNEGIVASDQAIIWRIGLEMLLITAAGSVAVVFSGLLASQVGAGFARDLRTAIFIKVESFSLSEIDKFSTASLITRSTNDVQQLQMVSIMIMRMVLQAPIMAVGAIINALRTAPNLTWTIAAGIIALFVLVIIMFTIVVPKFKIVQKLIDRLNLVTRENLTGLRVVRAFRNEKYEEEKFAEANHDLTKLNLFINRMMNLMQPMVMLIFNGMLLLIIWVGAHLVISDGLEIGNMMAFMQYAGQVMMSFMFLAMLMIFLPRAQVSAGRIGEVLSTKLTIKPPKNPIKPKKKVRGLVEFRDVTFGYPESETPVLKDVSFVAQPGQTTAFIGSTGSGKSTLINLIPRFYDATAGQVLINNVNVQDLAPADLIKRIGYIPQKGILFSGTVASNIKYGASNASNVAVKKAVQIAQADFVHKLEGGFEHHMAQGGSNISGGQKQRLSIARAVVKNPEIYIFDDSFSALDFKTDAALRKALAPITKDATTLIVAQRISTIKSADQIIVLDEGHVVGRGTHSELLQNCVVYQEIARSQFSDKEMAKELESADIKDHKEKK
jgi:ATP-binding cassette subfamily B protein